MGKRENTVWAAARVLKASGRLRRVRFVSIAFFMLACFVLPLQAAAQTQMITLTAADDVCQGEDLVYPISLDQAMSDAIVISLNIDKGRGNFENSSGTLTFTIPKETTNVEVRVPTRVNPPSDTNPLVSLLVTSVINGIQVNPRQLDSNILDRTNPACVIPDNATVTISNGNVIESVTGGVMPFSVALSAAVSSDVVLGVTYAPGQNNPVTLADDLGTQPGTITITEGNTKAILMVPVTDDNIVEGDETFTVTVAVNTAPDGVTIGNGVATGTIEDNDMARVRLTPRRQTAAESEMFNYTVSLNAPVSRAVNITWTASDDTATVMDDLEGDLDGTLSFAPNNTADQTFSIAVNDDDAEEENETFTVTIRPTDGSSLPDGVEIAPNRISSMATITDNDEALDSQNSITTSGSILTIANADPVDEGGTASFEITIEPPISSSSINPTVSYIAGSADLEDLGSDRLTGAVQIRGGMDSHILEVPIHDDDIAEGDETFTVRLTFGNAGSIQATGTINASDGETSPPPASGDNATVSISNGDELENITGGIMPFTVTLSAAVSRDVVLDVTYTPGETAASPRPPATLADDLGDLPDTITITEGTTEATLMVPVVNDSLVEDVLEVFTVTLEEDEDSPLPEGVTILDGVAIGVIEDNDLASVTLSPETLTAAENESFEYTVSLSAASSKDVNIAWAATAEVGDSATVADDLDAPRTGTVRFLANNNTAQTFSITATDDNTDEDNETFTVTISPTAASLPSGVEIDPEKSSSAATITDSDDTPAVTATISIGDKSVRENGSSVDFTVSLTTAVDSDLVLDVGYEGDGDNPIRLASDLGSGRPTTVTIEDGETSATITVPVNNDALVEGDETFAVILRERSANPLPDGVTIDDGRAIGTIEDNDTGQVTLSPARLTAAEDGKFTYTVSLSMAAQDAVTVRWTASAESGDTATVADDLQAPRTDTVTFTAGNVMPRPTFTINPVNDNEDEDNETFTVTLSADEDNPLPTGITIGTADSSKATITDNDDLSTVTVNIDDASATEEGAGGNIAFTVRLAQAVDENVVLAVAYAPGTDDPATLADDLGTLPPTVTINQGETRATITVPVIDDDIVEENETFTVTISEVPTNRLPADVMISDDVATGTITSGDTATVRVDGGTVLEDSGVLFIPVSLSAGVSSDVVLDVTYAAGLPNPITLADDLGLPLPPTVMIVAGTRDGPIRVPIFDDNIVEDDETFIVTISESRASPLPNGVTIFGSQVMITIIDDDVEEEEDDVSRILPILYDLLLLD